MLAPDERSVNNEAADKTPLVGRRIVQRLANMFGSGQRNVHNEQGYVEFGTIQDHNETRTLNTFAGVFSPVTLSMFSALIFLRMGYIVGNAGLLETLLQFLIAYLIIVFTVSSVCAISTNGAVEGGGAYYMISRTLGPEFGGSIGTLFFFANIVSSALCISGCVEGLVENFGPSGYIVSSGMQDGRWWQFLYCTLLNTLNLLVCLIGAGMFAKTSVFVLAIVCGCLSIVFFSFFYEGPQEIRVPDSNHLISNITNHSTYSGLQSSELLNNLWPQYGRDYTSHGELVTFATVFGVLFSGVTGIMAGANMSGELKNPGKSIPRGTLSAMAFTCIIYLGVSILTAATCTRDLLQNNYLFMAGVSSVPISVAIGLLTATWSAALSNLIGGSRVLEALAKDRVFGSLLDLIPKGTWRGNPLAAVVISWILVQMVLLIGSLNVIAQLNSILFLLSYLAMNLACLGLELASAPNFRPSFKYFTWHTALMGLLGTLIMMFVINAIYAACSILACVMLVIFLHLFSPSKESDWGSISQALIFHQVRKYLLLLDSRKDHVKFWRPQVLLLVNSPRSACPLIDFINDLKKGGLYVLGHVITSEESEYGCSDPALEAVPHWLNLVDHLHVKAFVEITVAARVRDGLQHLMRLSGMGAMKPNTVIFGFLDGARPSDFLQSTESSYTNSEFSSDVFPLHENSTLSPEEYVQMMKDVLRMNKNLCLCRHFFDLNIKHSKDKKYIDVWPVNFLSPGENDAFDTTSLFMMQLACIVNMVPKWQKLTLRVCVCDETRQSSFSLSGSQQSHSDRLRVMLKDLRISAELYPVNGWREVIEAHGSNMDSYFKSINGLISQQTGQTAVTFIYLPAPPEDNALATSYLKSLEVISDGLTPTIYVHGVNIVTSTTL